MTDPWDNLMDSALSSSRADERDHAAVEKALFAVRKYRSRSLFNRYLQTGLAAAAVLAGLTLTFRPQGSSAGNTANTVSPQYAYDAYSEVDGW